MSYNEKNFFTKTKFGKWLSISFVLVLLSGCSVNKEELNKEASNIPSNEQETKVDKVDIKIAEEKEIAIPYDDFEYYDFYTQHILEFTDVYSKAFGDIQELISNQNLLTDFSFMTSYRLKIKRLTELNEIFKNLSNENRVPDISLKLHKLTQETIGFSIPIVNSVLELVKNYSTTKDDDVLKLEEHMNLSLKAMSLEFDKYDTYLKNKKITEEKNTATINQEETVNKNSDKNTITTKTEDYNTLGEYQPVESMTQDEIQKELERFFREALGE